jgi:hypothetical protein
MRGSTQLHALASSAGRQHAAHARQSRVARAVLPARRPRRTAGEQAIGLRQCPRGGPLGMSRGAPAVHHGGGATCPPRRLTLPAGAVFNAPAALDRDRRPAPAAARATKHARANAMGRSFLFREFAICVAPWPSRASSATPPSPAPAGWPRRRPPVRPTRLDACRVPACTHPPPPDGAGVVAVRVISTASTGSKAPKDCACAQ